ncbi:MAG TPA: ribonuclease PH [Caulobacteraceae bacterium]|nr:ribonuclease PH [Caulobacteraceae bacterium]
MTRPDGRRPDELRPLSITPDWLKDPEGSALIRAGETWVICTASVEEKVPPFLKDSGKGWVTAEYAMLPRATNTRGGRQPGGRGKEIERLIGRALRASIDMAKLGQRTITIDCDVLQADGGTRTAAITGGWVALRLATRMLMEEGVIAKDPILDHVAAISCGLVDGEAALDLDYEEDSNAEADANFVLTGKGLIVEAQATGEKRGFSRAEFDTLIKLAQKGIAELVEKQTSAVS